MPPKPIVPKTPVTKPPVQTPPVQTPPVQTPPVQTPPVLFTIPHYFTDTIIRLRGMIKLIGR
jgi:hypothetical protein